MGDGAIGYTTAREHAVRASELLNGVDRLGEHVASLDEDGQLQARIAGSQRVWNEQMRFWRDLALAHAETALALKATEEGGDG